MTSAESGQKAVPNIISENGQYESNYIGLYSFKNLKNFVPMHAYILNCALQNRMFKIIRKT